MRFFKFYAASLFLLCLTSCATTLKIQVERPAKVDLGGAKTIAVLPFKSFKMKGGVDVFDLLVDVFIFDYDYFNPDEKRCVEKLKYEIERGLAKSPYVALVDFSEVRTAVKNNYINPADVYFTGGVPYFHIDDVANKVRRPVTRHIIDEKGNKKEIATYEYSVEFSRNVIFDFNYKVVNSADSKVLANGSFSLSAESAHYNSKGKLPSAYDLLQYKLSGAAEKILQEIQPYTVTKSIKLLKDKTKNPDMKKADKLAKNFQLMESFDEYLKIYDSAGFFEAGYNAALLKEATGDFSGAKKMMEELYQKTFDERAAQALGDIENEIYQAERLKKQIETKDEFLDF